MHMSCRDGSVNGNLPETRVRSLIGALQELGSCQ